MWPYTLLVSATLATAAIPNDPLLSFDPSLRLPWAQGASSATDTYQWAVSNTEPVVRLFSDGEYVSQEFGVVDSGLPLLWALGSTSAVKVAILDDSGFDVTHPDLAANIVAATNCSGGPVYSGSHGTEVASVVGAVGNNRIGLAGVCWSVPLYVASCSRRSPSGSTPEIAVGIQWALEKGCRIIILPIAVSPSAATSNAFWKVGQSNALVFASAMNSPADHDASEDYPTSWRMPHVLTITSTARDGLLVGGGAGYGAQTVFCGAPGRRVPVAVPGGYAFDTGASYAAPFAAGIAALLMTLYPNDTTMQTKARLAALSDGRLVGLTQIGGNLDLRRLHFVRGPSSLRTQ